MQKFLKCIEYHTLYVDILQVLRIDSVQEKNDFSIIYCDTDGNVYFRMGLAVVFLFLYKDFATPAAHILLSS